MTSKVRRSTLFAPASYIEGWAHYCEQMMLEAGFGRGDSALKLGQLGEALVRLARFVVGIRLHTDDWSVEQGVRFFREEAFLEEASARREAERGTFDPTYIVYSIGKLMLLKLRHDWQEEQHGKTTLRAFHDAFLAQGSAPFPALRRLMLDHAPATSWSNRANASVRISMRPVCAPLRGHPEVLGPPHRRVPEVRRGGAQAAVVAGDSVQGVGLVHHRLRARGQV